MSSTNENHPSKIGQQDVRAGHDRAVATLCARISADEAVLAAKGISAFNLECAARALAGRRGGALVMRIPSQAGKPVEFRYEGLAG